MNHNSLAFETQSPSKLFLHCALPAMCSMVFGALYTIADGIFVGRYVGENALAAVNLAMPLVNISFAIADMIAVGSSVQIAMFLGERNKEAANRIFSFSIKIIFAVSILTGLFFLFFTKPVFMLMGANGQALQYAFVYMGVYALFSPVTMVYYAADNYLRICNRQKYSMILNISTALLNIVLDFLLIVVFESGVLGAALASCISMAIGSFFSLLPFFRKKLELRFIKGKFPAKQFVSLLANGSSEFFSNISSSVMAFILNIVLMRLGGTTAVAAMSIVLYVDSLMVMMIFGMCDSMQPPISYCHAAGLKKRVLSLEKRVLLSAALLSLGAFFFLRYGGNRIIPFFVTPEDTALLELSAHAMELYAFSYLVNWIYRCLSSYLTAMGQAGKSFAVSICGTLFFPLICLAALVPLWGFDGVCFMPLFAGLFSGVLAILLSVWSKDLYKHRSLQ
ncbi:MAG: MATE family efflux transporter [Butyricicoccus pullicaecorum]|nr:MATE family efflux transporter [Butyricicoccus pullicaecorum]